MICVLMGHVMVIHMILGQPMTNHVVLGHS
ncbi:hypothetical protein J2756_001842 [Methanobacterium aggregans]|nr:hypothetical protein [Methanobacterium aggregans]